jgi:hypothetical protein
MDRDDTEFAVARPLPGFAMGQPLELLQVPAARLIRQDKSHSDPVTGETVVGLKVGARPLTNLWFLHYVQNFLDTFTLLLEVHVH